MSGRGAAATPGKPVRSPAFQGPAPTQDALLFPGVARGFLTAATRELPPPSAHGPLKGSKNLRAPGRTRGGIAARGFFAPAARASRNPLARTHTLFRVQSSARRTRPQAIHAGR